MSRGLENPMSVDGDYVPPFNIVVDETLPPGSMAIMTENQVVLATNIKTSNQKKEKPMAAAKRVEKPATVDNNIINMPVTDIKPNPNQPRKIFDETRHQELVQSVKQDGVLQPIVVRPLDKGFQIVVGERRYRAAVAAKLKTIPVLVKHYDDKETQDIALIENLQRNDLTPLEVAAAIKARLDADPDLQKQQLAVRLGISPALVTMRLALCEIGPKTRKALEQGKIVAEQAVDIYRRVTRNEITEEEGINEAIAFRKTRAAATAALKAAKQAAKKNGKHDGDHLTEEATRPIAGARKARQETDVDGQEDDEVVYSMEEKQVFKVVGKIGIPGVLSCLQKLCDESNTRAWKARKKILLDAERAINKVPSDD